MMRPDRWLCWKSQHFLWMPHFSIRERKFYGWSCLCAKVLGPLGPGKEKSPHHGD